MADPEVLKPGQPVLIGGPDHRIHGRVGVVVEVEKEVRGAQVKDLHQAVVGGLDEALIKTDEDAAVYLNSRLSTLTAEGQLVKVALLAENDEVSSDGRMAYTLDTQVRPMAEDNQPQVPGTEMPKAPTERHPQTL